MVFRSSLPGATRESTGPNPDRGAADLPQRTARLFTPMAVAGSGYRRREGHDLLDHRFRYLAAGSGARPAPMDDLPRLCRPECGIAVAGTADPETRLRTRAIRAGSGARTRLAAGGGRARARAFLGRSGGWHNALCATARRSA